MPWHFWVIEICVFLFAAGLVRHALRQGGRWLSTYLWGMGFGLVVELIIVLKANPAAQHYVYGDFLLMVTVMGKGVPLWVGVGWGAIVYMASFTAQRLRSPWSVRPFSAGVLAVNIDLTLDPMAERLGFWTWHNVDPINLYGVPLDNFLGWFFIVSSYAFFARWLFRIIPANTWGRVVWIPPAGGILALIAVVLIELIMPHIYSLPLGQTWAFLAVFVGAAVLLAAFALRSRRDNPAELQVLGTVLGMHTISLFLLFFTGSFRELPSLMVFVPMTALVGFFAYSWCSIDRLFPTGAEGPPGQDAPP